MRLAIAVLGCALSVGAGAGCTPSTSGEPTTPASGTGSADTSGATPGKGPKGSAPDFTLQSLEGRNISLSDYLGKKVVLVDFWATTCQPCLVEMPHLVAMYEKYKDKGFIVLGVAGDGPETSANVSAEVHAKKISFPILLDEESSAMAKFSPKKDMPFWVLIDKNGNIVKTKNGYDPGDEVTLAQEIEKLLQ
ncbi:MAG: TlpA family protein disulfide reductase [Polyangiaceae bacterium]|nr:TlpA family protein disulfide reductase [Polyangiaceae bacterium]